MAITAPRIVVTGMFRGGLGYVRELLLRSGFVAGDTFDRHTTADNISERFEGCADIEVSPYVVPYLGYEQFAGTKVVYVLRDPVRVVGSLLHLGYPHDMAGPKASSWFQWASEHLKDYGSKFVDEDKAPEAALSLTHNWLKLARILRPDLQTVKLELGPRPLLETIAGWEKGRRIVYCPTDINAADWVRNPTAVSQDPHAFQLELDTLRQTQGYYERQTMPQGGHAHYTNPAFHC